MDIEYKTNHQILIELESAQEALDAAHERVVAVQEQFNAAKRALDEAQAQSDAAQDRLALAYADFFRAMKEGSLETGAFKARLDATLRASQAACEAPDLGEMDFSTFLEDAVSGDPARQAAAREQLAALGSMLASLGIEIDPERLVQASSEMRESYHAPEQVARRTEATHALQAISARAEEVAEDLRAQGEALAQELPTLSPFEQLGRLLEADGWSPRPLEGRPVYQMRYQGAHAQTLCFAQVEDDMQQLLFYVIAPVNAPEARRAAVAEYITRVNYGLRIGNFEFDYDDGEVRYKSSIDFESVGLTLDLLHDTMYPAVNTFDLYFPGLVRVIRAINTPVEAVMEIEGARDPEVG